MGLLTRQQQMELFARTRAKAEWVAARELMVASPVGHLAERCCGRLLRWEEVRGPEGRKPCQQQVVPS